MAVGDISWWETWYILVSVSETWRKNESPELKEIFLNNDRQMPTMPISAYTYNIISTKKPWTINDFQQIREPHIYINGIRIPLCVTLLLRYQTKGGSAGVRQSTCHKWTRKRRTV